MAKKKKEKDKEDLAEETAEAAETEEKETVEEDEDEERKEGSGAKDATGTSWVSLLRRWWIPGLIIIVFIAAGATFLVKPGLFGVSGKKDKKLPSIDITDDNLQEEVLSPFFIPPSPDLSKGAVRIDLTAIWDGVTSVRYKNNEVKIRAEVYNYLIDFDRGVEDPGALKTVIEEGIGEIFRRSLGTNEMAIRIKELKFI